MSLLQDSKAHKISDYIDEISNLKKLPIDIRDGICHHCIIYSCCSEVCDKFLDITQNITGINTHLLITAYSDPLTPIFMVDQCNRFVRHLKIMADTHKKYPDKFVKSFSFQYIIKKENQDKVST